MDQQIINLFDEYTHKPLKREEFISRLVKITGSMAAALTVLPQLEVNYVQAATVMEDDQDIVTEEVSYAGVDTMKAYLARPKTDIASGAVIVIHENRGLNPHIRDVTRRVAKSGFLALAPDALSPFGGTPGNEDEARNLFAKLDSSKNLNNFLKGFDYLTGRKESNGKTGCVGFCWGGALTNQLAVHSASLKSAASFYGAQPAAADVPEIKARLQLHYGAMDERVNAGIPEYEKSLKAAGTKYELFMYPGAQHAFYNDTAPTRYNEEAAELAWSRTIQMFKETLV